jgi:hypothetical protein
MKREFLESQDYIDISYMVKHVKCLSLRVNLIRQLGYCVGIERAMNNDKFMRCYTKNNGKELRLQITPPYGKFKCAYVVIIRDKSKLIKKQIIT